MSLRTLTNVSNGPPALGPNYFYALLLQKDFLSARIHKNFTYVYCRCNDQALLISEFQSETGDKHLFCWSDTL